MTLEDPDYMQDLHLFQSKDDQVALAAFQRLWARVRDWLAWKIYDPAEASDFAEDVLSETQMKVWRSRHKFVDHGPAGWRSYVSTIASRQAMTEKAKRKSERQTSLEEVQEVPESEASVVHRLVEAGQDLRWLLAMADKLWLGIPDAPEENDAHLLAAQLFYLHGMAWEDVARYLDLRDRHLLDAILGDEAVIRHMAFQELYWASETLAGYILRPEKPLTKDEVCKMRFRSQTETGAETGLEWGWEEIWILTVYLCNGLSEEQILNSSLCDRDAKELQELLDTVRERFPFPGQAEAVRKSLAKSSMAHLVADERCWRRIVFQYQIAEYVGHRQIVDRTGPAAAVCGAREIDLPLLHQWISMGRLLKQLAKFVEGEKRRG